MKKNERGYAILLELLIACAILLILAARTVPSAVRIQQTQNQNNVLTLLREVNAGEAAFAMAFPGQGYEQPAYLANSTMGFGRVGVVCATTCTCPNALAPSVASVFGSADVGVFSGYTLTFGGGQQSPTNNPGCGSERGFITYGVTAVPTTKLGGTWSFFTDSTGVIRYSQNGTPNAASPVWGE
jgi:type II secretory pathway pseudopilin PulG